MLKKAVQRGPSKVRDAMNKERQVCARRRDSEPAVSRAEASHSYPPHSSPAGTGSFPWGVRWGSERGENDADGLFQHPLEATV